MLIVSGIRPTSGSIHIGNYLGALKQWIDNQEQGECLFFIADLHAITTPYNPKELQKNILNTAAAYLAAGLDPQKSIIFVQSHIKEHTELCWLFNTICPIGDLGRMTQYKDKSKSLKNDATAGLLNYPILMAADILMYKANLVPVGKDQLQHIEFARTIARKFNQKFGEYFPEPKAQISKGEKIMSLQEPRKKMSKSDNPQSYIGIFDSAEEIEKKIMRAVTDTGKEIKYNEIRKPGLSNLIKIYSLFSGKEIKEIEKEFRGKGYGEFKKSLADLLIDSLEHFRVKKEDLLSREEDIKTILEEGANKARVISRTTMEEVRIKMGLSDN